ncbi:MAG: AAA family ATPase [Myxococcota bacterium]
MGGIETSVGRPVRGPNFFDREQEQRLLWQRLGQSHVLMLAPRRVGKTSLLLRLLDGAPQHGFHAVYVSVADAKSDDDVAKKLVAALGAHPAADRAWKKVKGPLRSIFGGLKAKVEAGPLTLELGGDTTWPTVAETAAEALDKLGERWLVLVDELPIFVLGLIRQDESGGRARSFLNWLRVLRNPVRPGHADAKAGAHAAPEPTVRWVVAGSIGLDAVVARANLGDTINDLDIFPLGPFSARTADEFLVALSDSYGLPLDVATRARLLERAGWLIPFYLQILFSKLHDLAAEQGFAPSPDLVDRVVEELLTPAYRAYFDYWRQRLTEELGRPDDQRAGHPGGRRRRAGGARRPRRPRPGAGRAGARPRPARGGAALPPRRARERRLPRARRRPLHLPLGAAPRVLAAARARMTPSATAAAGLRSVIYNPALLEPEASSLGVSLRRPLAERLLATLRRIGKDGAPQHQLVLGLPGSGKTMLLRALRTAIEADAGLSRRWFPITFPEAQWDVARPADVWRNALDYLVIALERRGETQAAAATRERLRELEAQPDEDGRLALQLLIATADRLERRFVLLIDTLDVVLDRLKRDQWHVREILASEPRLLVIGASARAIEATYRYDAAFYDFFQLHELRPLPWPELPRLLAALPPDPDRDALTALPEATLRTAVELVGAQPRTLALMARALRLEGPLPARSLVALVLDELTPWMEARMQTLAPQSQQVVHALASAWHPARPTDLAARAHLTVNAVSSHLHRLVQDGVAERVPLPPGLRQGFQLADRVFQVWLLLRMGQPHRRRLMAAADLLEAAFAAPDVGGSPRELGPVLAEDPTIAEARTQDADALMRVAPELRAALERLGPAQSDQGSPEM